MGDMYIYLLTGDEVQRFDQQMSEIVEPFITHTRRISRLAESSSVKSFRTTMDLLALIQKSVGVPEIMEESTRLLNQMEGVISFLEEFGDGLEDALMDIATITDNILRLFEASVCYEWQGLPADSPARGREEKAA